MPLSTTCPHSTSCSATRPACEKWLPGLAIRLICCRFRGVPRTLQHPGRLASMSDADTIKRKYEMLREALDERTRRLWAACEAIALGRGGGTLVAEATGMARATIRTGMREFEPLGLAPTPSALRRESVTGRCPV